MATITKRTGPHGRSVWQARVRVKSFPDQCCTFDRKAEAEHWVSEVTAAMRSGRWVDRTEAERTTLAEALERYEREVTSSKKSYVQERSVIATWRNNRLSRLPLAAVRSQDLASVRDEWMTTLEPATIRRRFALLSHLFEIAKKEWGMEYLPNPTRSLRQPRIANSRERRFVENEEARLWEVAQAYGGEIERIIRFALETAMRRGEIAAMRWEHVDRKARILKIPETKTGEPRRIPLSTIALATLNNLPRRFDGKIWSMRPDSISQAFERVCILANIQGLTFHDLRHEATSRLFERGLNLMQVAAITGHKSLQMLKRYTHLRAEDLVDLLG